MAMVLSDILSLQVVMVGSRVHLGSASVDDEAVLAGCGAFAPHRGRAAGAGVRAHICRPVRLLSGTHPLMQRRVLSLRCSYHRWPRPGGGVLRHKSVACTATR